MADKDFTNADLLEVRGVFFFFFFFSSYVHTK